MSHSGTSFVTTYFEDGRKKKIPAGGYTLANYAYTDFLHSSKTVVTYPTAEKRSAYYNALENPIKSTYTNNGTDKKFTIMIELEIWELLTNLTVSYIIQAEETNSLP